MFFRKKSAKPETAPFDVNAVYTIAAAGTVAQLREHFEEALWRGHHAPPAWEALRLALLREDRAMMRLLILRGVRPSAYDMAALKNQDQKKFSERLDLLRRHGIEPPEAIQAQLSLEEKFDQSPAVLGMKQEWLDVLTAMQAEGASEALIAGGAVRDTFTGRPVRDIDIFLETRGTEKDNTQFLNRVFERAGIEIREQACYDSYDRITIAQRFLCAKTAIFKREFYNFTEKNRLESWQTVAGPDRTEYNIVFIRGGLANDMRRRPKDLIETFDVGICRAATDGRKLFRTREFEHDICEKTLTLCLENDASLGHMQRLIAKYPDFRPCWKARQLLDPPPEKKRGFFSREPEYWS